jgi:hypothetical protein
MKKLLLFIALIAAGFSFSQKGIVDDLVGALRTGNASKMATYFDNVVEISLPDKNDTYTKGEAEVIIKDFFTAKSVKGFDVIHKGDNNGSQFLIGTLQTKNGNYRATIFLKQKADKQLLQQLRIESK